MTNQNVREIKFRAWDKRDERMWTVGAMDWADNKIITVNCVGKDAPKLYQYFEESDCTGFVLMQYTGLKDKNGKEIYEGDITDEHGDRGIVKMIHGCWCTDYIELEPHPILAKRVVEVIGNIYENPELCQQKNSN